MNDHLKILGFQLKLDLESNPHQEYLIESKYYHTQINCSLALIEKFNPDIVIYPEMSFSESYHEDFQRESKNRLLIVGSIYRGNSNTTIVYQNGKRFEISKLYASGAEPMTRFLHVPLPNRFLVQHLKDHTFTIKGKKIVILNCMEYYHVAYYIARNCEDIFALISPCSNNNPKIFKQETIALHNHNENIYSFVINCISTYNQKEYGKGQSYIYGPIQEHERIWLKESGILLDQHPCSILTLEQEASYFYGEFANCLTPYGRSDHYKNNPQNMLINKLIEEEQK